MEKIKLSERISKVSPSLTLAITAKAKAMLMMPAIACRWDIPKAMNLWWIWFLSGRKRGLRLRQRCRTTRTTSSMGTIRNENAITTVLGKMLSFTGSDMLRRMAITASSIPMVSEPVSPMNILRPRCTLP